MTNKINDWRTNTPGRRDIKTDFNSLMDHIAESFIELAISYIEKKQSFFFLMGGGRTPKAINARLVKMANRLDWSKITIFFCDERCVPPEHPDSNFGMINETLIKPLEIPKQNVYRIAGECIPERAAEKYEQQIRNFLGTEGFPEFDLALLGLGPDGHTASLFPGKRPKLADLNKLVIPAGKGPDGHERITLTFPIINHSRNIWFMISGKEKRKVVKKLFFGCFNPFECPAQGIRPENGELVYMMDRSVF